MNAFADVLLNANVQFPKGFFLSFFRFLVLIMYAYVCARLSYNNFTLYNIRCGFVVVVVVSYAINIFILFERKKTTNPS